jgi:serine/threonine-protein kinase RsbW
MKDGIPPQPVTEDFTLPDLRRIRSLVEETGLLAGLDEQRVTELVAVVNELAVNAILYAGGGGSLTMTRTPGGLAVEISDRGPGLPATATGLERPPPNVPGGRGLWLARQMFPDLVLASSAAGLSVSLYASGTGFLRKAVAEAGEIATELAELIGREGRSALVWQQRFRQIAGELAAEAPAPQVLAAARECFDRLYTAGRNFADFHLWRDDITERLAANEHLTALVGRLRDLLRAAPTTQRT